MNIVRNKFLLFIRGCCFIFARLRFAAEGCSHVDQKEKMAGNMQERIPFTFRPRG